MTRRGLVSGLLATPFAAVAAKRSVASETTRGKTIVFPSGVYRIASGGGIHVVGDDVYISECVFEGCTIQATAPGL